MDGSHTRRYFLEPQQTFRRQYEALRAIFVDDQPVDRVAERFGYKPSALKSMASRLRADCRRGAAPPFFSPMAADDLRGRVPGKIDRTPRCTTSRIVAS
jgi:hypothetical protein